MVTEAMGGLSPIGQAPALAWGVFSKLKLLERGARDVGGDCGVAEKCPAGRR